MKKVVMLGMVGLMIMMSCNQNPGQAEANVYAQNKSDIEMEQNSLMEIAIRKVKAGKDEAFLKARNAFINKLKDQDGIERDWEFKSFFTMPEPDETDVFVGMTRYESAAAMQKIADKLMQSPEANQFFNTFDMKAFVAVQPADGGDFKLEDHIGKENVLEIAVRTVKQGHEADFEAKRKTFFDLIAQQDGYLFDREFIGLQSGDKVVLIGWKSFEDFQKAAGFLQKQSEMAEFFGILDVKAYQAVTSVN